ncbi:MAG TPA: type II secretion system protein [Rhizomicrobium sp.]|nr:type II secretion system protein [Rhizomicrobium sp.]
MMREKNGYALIEMLVSLAIIGLISVMMVAGLGTTRRVWQHMDAANAVSDQVAGAQILLRNQLERVIPATRFDSIPSYADFTGKADSINFLAPPRDAEAPTTPQRYLLSLTNGGDLVLSFLPDIALDRATPRSLVLLHNVQGLDIAYYGYVPPPDNRIGWQFDWEKRPAPPKLIRIRVQFPPQDARVWPDLLIKPYTTVDTMCVLIVRTGKCRGRA